MKLGLVYPQTELSHDPRALHEIGLASEQLGYDSIVFYDHVVGAAHADRNPVLWGPYTEADPFHDPFVAFGYLAAITSKIELATAVLIAPQRQTVLIAQQAADVDLLSGERLRLGVGTGWNYVEYDALGQDFATRGARLDEQILFLRRLWSEPLMSFEGRFDRIERGCINPHPKRSIPLWIGGFGEPAFRRAGRFGDGFSFAGSIDDAIVGLGRVRHHLRECGRSEVPFGTELVLTRPKTPREIAESAEQWQEAGGTNIAVVSMRLGLDSIGAHIDYFDQVRTALANTN